MSICVSSKKAQRIKFLFEELPTFKYLQYVKLSLYKDWFCFYCYNTSESFNHVWTYPKKHSTLQGVINLCQEVLIILLHHIDPNLSHDNPHLLDLLNNTDLWNPIASYSSFTFVDLIKGLVLSKLSQSIHRIVNTKQLTTAVITAFMQIVQDKIQKDIWLFRYKLIIKWEKYLNITSYDKSTKGHGGHFFKWSVYVPDHLTHLSPVNSSLISYDTLLHNSIYSGFNFRVFRRVLTLHSHLIICIW